MLQEIRRNTPEKGSKVRELLTDVYCSRQIKRKLVNVNGKEMFMGDGWSKKREKCFTVKFWLGFSFCEQTGHIKDLKK